MKDLTARAMQIAVMEEDTIRSLQALEKNKGIALSNFNIQQIFNLPTIKQTCLIPEDDNEAQQRHSNRIEAEIEFQKLKGMADPNESGLDWIHSFDWAVFFNKNKIVWEYIGGRSNQKLSDRVKLACS